ncbi:Ureidoglycolate hydrolase [Capsicum annuum]|uniref:Ureidoglycolate hydrolase n=1 Tax=Capsicum annuum TaxID=4072 RepID=A0A2G2ZUE5_CAPAN|nr:Ureidoglycolate hydrolase [Capsicum annuum]KAF3649720.1 Ureidoglycolate hydrolase [Capsicum annuum]PHT85604.1 Ureidoglycolate hydrolase [Capsicum annuum]
MTSINYVAEAGIVQFAEQLISTKDSHNVSFSDADKSVGYANAKGDLSEVFLKKGTYSAFVKLHIEQGPILEKGQLLLNAYPILHHPMQVQQASKHSIGVVTAIAAPASIKVTFEGNGGHAGAALMPKASELTLAVQKHVLNSGSVDTFGTVGVSATIESIGHSHVSLLCQTCGLMIFSLKSIQNHLCTGCSAELMYVLEPTKKVAAVKLIDD